MHTYTWALRKSIGQILTEVRCLSLVHNFYSFSLFLEREGTEMSCDWLGMEPRSWSFSLGAILDIYGGREKNSCTTYSWMWWWVSYGHTNHTKDAQLGFPFFQNNWGRGEERVWGVGGPAIYWSPKCTWNTPKMCSWIFPFFQMNVRGCWWHNMLFISFQCWSGINFWTTWSWYQIFLSFMSGWYCYWVFFQSFHTIFVLGPLLSFSW